MDYSVYIIQDRNKSNEDILKALAGDTELGEHFKNVGAAAVADAVGADILDRYATDDALGQNGVAIRGNMIDSVSIKPALVKKETFDKGTTQVVRLLTTTITVTGNLFAPSFIEMKSKTVKNKNMARVLAWASLPQTKSATQVYANDIMANTDDGGEIATDKNGYTLTPIIQTDYILHDDPKEYEKFYYRRVLVTVYSNTDTQFRAILHDKVYVDSYEEVYSDKDGNGKFTLVMKCIGTNVFDTFIAGPTYKWSVKGSALSVVDEISTAASQATKATNKVVETVDKVAGTHISKTVEEYTKKVDYANDGLEYITKDDITIDSIGDNVQKQAEDWHPTAMQDAIEQAADYQKAYSALTDDQKATLANIPGFNSMDISEKLEYIKKLTGE